MRTSRIHRSKDLIVQHFESLHRRVFTRKELASILRQNLQEWRLPPSISVDRFVGFLETEGLQRERFSSSIYPSFDRHTWSNPGDYRVAAELYRSGYLAYWSAAYLHGLTEQIPTTIYVNREQSAKPRPTKPLTQQSIHSALRKPPRETRYVFDFRGRRIAVISGKYTGSLEVGETRLPEGDEVRVTKVERTLVDIAVRPEYAGGPHEVLRCYLAAKGRISSNVLAATLKRLDYVYPYHQAIGFYMAKAGYPADAIAFMERIPRRLDFYLCRNIGKPAYDPRWRLFIPPGLPADVRG